MSKTVTISLQLRVPNKMRAEEIRKHILNHWNRSLVECGGTIDEPNFDTIWIYRDRVEVFAP